MHLAKVYVEYGEALEWDLFHYWNVDINDESLTIRRLWNFFSRLPRESETLQDIAGVSREARAWDMNTWMLAHVVDGLRAVDWHLISAFSKNKPSPPKPFERPTVVKKKAVWPGKTFVDKKGINNGEY